MPSAGQFVLNGEGKWVVDSQGRWRVFDASGGCDPCCGPGPNACRGLFSLNFERTWTCELDGLVYTQTMRNSWSDDFNWGDGNDIPLADNLVMPPCANYLRYSFAPVVGQIAARATTPLSPVKYGGPYRMTMPAQRFSRYWLWNGGGPSITFDASITLNRSIFINGIYPPVVTLFAYATTTAAGVGDQQLTMGKFQSQIFAGGVARFLLDDVDTGNTIAENTQVRIQSTGTWQRVDLASVRFAREATFTVGGVSYTRSHQSALIGWPTTQATPFPDLCLCRFDIKTGSSYSIVADNLSAAIINPTEPV